MSQPWFFVLASNTEGLFSLNHYSQIDTYENLFDPKLQIHHRTNQQSLEGKQKHVILNMGVSPPGKHCYLPMQYLFFVSLYCNKILICMRQQHPKIKHIIHYLLMGKNTIWWGIGTMKYKWNFPGMTLQSLNIVLLQKSSTMLVVPSNLTGVVWQTQWQKIMINSMECLRETKFLMSWETFQKSPDVLTFRM